MRLNDFEIERLEPGIHEYDKADGGWILANWSYDGGIIQPGVEHAVAGDTVGVERGQGLGDVLMVTPTLKAFADRGLKVSMWTINEFMPVFDHNPDVVSVHDMGTFNANVSHDLDYNCDLVGVVERDPRHPEINRTELFARISGVQIESRKPLYYPTDDELAEAEERWGPKTPRVALVARTSTERRDWPYMQELAAALAPDDISMGVFGASAPQCWEGHGAVNFGGIGLRNTFAMLATADVCVTPDTGLLFAAVSVDTPTIAIFGCWPPHLCVEGYQNVFAFDANEILGRVHCYDSLHCSGAQLAAVTVDMVAAQVCTFLSMFPAEGR